MALPPGTRLGVYEITAQIGEGAMGQVYRARDTRLQRDVALKVLPDAFANDADRLTRFTREAQTLAVLNHPNIAHIHGLEESPGSGQVVTRALVMELVEGEDLSRLIARGALPLADVLPIARQIADALEAAHEQGIVHRDLKPANVKVRSDGTVKVLDFGLAKALDPNVGRGFSPADPGAAESTTVTSPAMTAIGVVLGTAAYMPPEQARGKVVDRRADIWAFGVVLYEMLTGVRPFAGEGFSDVLAAVLRHEIDWSRLPASTPPRLRELLARCLDPDVKQRLRDIGEARVVIAAIERGEAPPRLADGQHQSWWASLRLAWSIAAVVVLAGASFVVRQMTLGGGSLGAGEPGNEVVRLSVLPPPGLDMNRDSANVAISPNGRMVAFVVGTGVSSENQLWVRPLDSSTARRIEDGDGVAQPFWSPGSGRIAFFANGKLKTVGLGGGTAQIVCDAPFGRGGTWNASNVIVFAPDSTGPLYRVPASSGVPEAVTTLEVARKETGHRFPVFLPDGDHFLYAALPGTDGMFKIFSGSLRDSQARTLIGSMESAPVYAPPGWLLFTRQGVLAAQQFDALALRLTGEAVSLGDQPSVAPGSAAYDAGRRVSASTAGALAFYMQASGNTNVQWMDLTGKTTATVTAPAGRYSGVAIAPDNTRAVLVRSDSPASSSVWLVDLTRASAIPLWSGSGNSPSPVWSPDSSRIVFAVERAGRWGLYEQTVTEASTERPILMVDNSAIVPRAWSNDHGIVFSRIDPDTKWNIYRVPASGSAVPVALVNGRFIEVGGLPSPDNRWLAYQSDEAGRLDLFVQTFPSAGQRTQVASGGIQQYWWAPGGRHLLYTKRDQTLWRVGVDLGGAVPRIGTPLQVATFPPALVAMDLAPDGQRFLALVPEHAGLGAVMVVQSWRAALTAGSNRFP